MRSFFLKLFKWAIILAFLAGAVYGGRQFYRNRQMLLAYLGGPATSSSEKPNEQEITVGICDRPASLAIYAAVGKSNDSNSQWLKAKRFGSYEELWEALELGTIDYAYVSLDQMARQAFITSPCVIFPYAQSSGSDGIVCSSAWDSPTPGHPRHIACVTGSTGEYIARLVCDKYMDSSTPVELAGAASITEAQELLTSGQAEALAVCQPLLGELLNKGYKLLTNESIPLITEVCVAKNHSLDNNTNQYALRLVLASTSFRCSENLIQRPGPMYSLIAKISGLERDEVRATLQTGLSFITQDEAVSMLKSSRLDDELSHLIDFWALSDSVFTATGKSVPSGKGLVSGILLNVRPRQSFKDDSTPAQSSSPTPAQIASPSDQSGTSPGGDPFTISPATENEKESSSQTESKDEDLTGSPSDAKAQRLGEESGQDEASKSEHSKSAGSGEDSDQEWAERKPSGQTERLGENGDNSGTERPGIIRIVDTDTDGRDIAEKRRTGTAGASGRHRGKYRIEGQGSGRPRSSGENGSQEQAISQDAGTSADEASDTDKYLPRSNANFIKDDERFMLEGQPGEAGTSRL